MKRLLALLVVLGLALAPARLAAQSIPVGPGSELSSLVGMPIDVPIVVDLSARSERLGSFALRLQWDPAVLRLEMSRDGTFGSVTANSDSIASGILRLAGVNPAGVAGRVTLGILRLTPLTGVTTTLQLALGELFAAGTFADLWPDATVSNGQYCPARGLWGDIDKDGSANSRDALIALSNAVGLDVSAFDVGLGDVDASGTTNARDALVILSNAVGVSTTGFRVLRIAGGACTTGGSATLTITPVAVEVVSGQGLLFEARASDSTGALQTVADVVWKTSNAAVLAVLVDGHATARDTGTATVTAMRGTRDSAQTTVRVVARRTIHWVDAAAAGAQNRLGTPAFPYRSIEEALGFARDGDTIRVRPGRYAPDNEWGTFYLDRPVVLMGDTAADGSRPTVVGVRVERGDGFDLVGEGTRELHNFTFEGFGTGIWVNGPDRVLLSGIRLADVWSGVYISAPVRDLRIERSRFLGVGDYGESSGGNGVTVDADIETVTIEDTEIGDFQSGVYEYATIDSLTVRGSLLHDFQSYVLKLGWCAYGCETTPPANRAPGSTARPRPREVPANVPRGVSTGDPLGRAVVIERSRLERGGYRLIDLEDDVRRVAFAHNVFSNPGGDVLYLSGSMERGYVSMKGDSIVSPPDRQHDWWIDARYLDSLVIDSLQAVGLTHGSTYSVPLVRITNSTLRDVGGYCGECTPTALEVDFRYSGGVLQLENDSVVGDPREDLRSTAFLVHGARVEANRVTAVNLLDGIDASFSDSSVAVTNSLFRHVAYPIYWRSDSYAAPATSALTVQNTTFRGFSRGIESYDGRVEVDSNTFVNGVVALDLSGPRQITVSRNRISGTQYPTEIYTYDSTTTVTVTDNVLNDVVNDGIYVEGTGYAPDTLHTVIDVRRNTVTCSATPAPGTAGIALWDANLTVLDNAVSGCPAGIKTIVNNPNARRDSLVGNTVTIPAGALFGIGVTGNALARIRRNTVSGATTGVQQNGLIDVASCPAYWCPDEYIPRALIDSNQVTGGTTWGIHAEYVDTLLVAHNTVTNLNTANTAYGAYSDDYGAIAALYSFSNVARILGNVVRQIVGNGIVVRHGSGTTVAVDSNVVAEVDSTAIYHGAGPISIRWNLVSGAKRDGIRILGYDAATVTDNNITGNIPFGLRVLASRTLDATNNWWNHVDGPSCDTCSGVGDSVAGYIMPSYAPWRSVLSPDVPVLPGTVARFLAAGSRPSAAAPVASSDPLDVPLGPRDRLAAPRVRPQRTASARQPTLAGVRAEREAAAARDRAVRAARRDERLQRIRARVEERERTRQTQAAEGTAATARRGDRPAGQEVRP